MNYIEKSTTRYPVTEFQIREEFPNVSFPTPFIPPTTFATVHETTPPSGYNAGL